MKNEKIYEVKFWLQEKNNWKLMVKNYSEKSEPIIQKWKNDYKNEKATFICATPVQITSS